MGDRPITIRIPVLENIATQFGGAFAQGESRYLNTREKTEATKIFQQSIDLNPVRLVVTTVVSAPTTLANNIRIPPGRELPDDTLIHELTHVWQYQTRGNSYISDSFIHQAAGILSGASREAAYKYVIVPGQSIRRYTAEHQAMIVQDYYSKPWLQTNPDYQRMITEVRSARPVFTSMDSYQESLYGAGYQNRRATDSYWIETSDVVVLCLSYAWNGSWVILSCYCSAASYLTLIYERKHLFINLVLL